MLPAVLDSVDANPNSCKVDLVCGRRHPRDLGQALLLMLGVVAVVATIAISVAAVGHRLIAHQRAVTAADAAALAGTTGGRSAAQRLASANGGVLVGFVEQGDIVVVRVSVDGIVVTARATDGP